MIKPLSLVLALTFALVPAASALAATTTPGATTNPGQGLQIIPPIINSQANPGQTVTVSVAIRNISSGPLVIKGQADDFGAKDETGQPQILLDETTPGRFSLKSWIGNVPSITLAAQTTANIPVRIAVPSNAEPGGHYGDIRFTGTPPSLSGSGVALSASIAALVLFTVNGDITHRLSTIDSAALNAAGQRHKLFEAGPVTILERIKNEGNVHELPVGDVVVKNMLGKTVATLPINPTKGSILPDSIRRFTAEVPKKGLFGRYSVTSKVTYNGSTVLTLPSTSFWIIPYRLIALVVIGLLVVLFLLRYAIKRYNRHIIAQARRRR